MNMSERFCHVAVDVLESVVDGRYAEAIGQMVIARHDGLLQQKFAQDLWCSATVDRLLLSL